MGLDIYVKEYEDFEEAKMNADLYEQKTSALWDKFFPEKDSYDKATKEKKDEFNEERDKITKEMGFSDGEAKGVTTIELDSKCHPEHMFKIGYLRSSYNEGGLNAITRRHLGKGLCDGLYYIFDHTKEDYEFRPNWEQALERTRAVRKALIEADKGYDVFEVSSIVPNEEPTNESEALAVFKKQLDSNADKGGAYSCRDGHFHIKEPLSMVAMIPGVHMFMNRAVPCTYMVFKREGGLKWYTEALDVVEEMCEWALAHKNKDNLYMTWSA